MLGYLEIVLLLPQLMINVSVLMAMDQQMVIAQIAYHAKMISIKQGLEMGNVNSVSRIQNQ